MKKLPTAVAYCRVASRGQRKDKSIAKQKKLIKKFARENEIKVLGWFVDTGYNKNYDSGFVNAFARIVKNNRANKPVQYFIATRPDRLSRDLNTFNGKLEVLDSEGVKLVCANGGTLAEQLGPASKFQEMLAIVIAEYSHQLRSDRIKLALRRKKEQAKASLAK